MEDENFRKELEDLFKLFKRLIEKENLNDLPGVDPHQVEQLKAFMAQFDDVKDKRISPEEIVSQREEQLKDVSDETARNRSLLETIDEQLKNPDLTDEEIDALLDKRTQISSKLSVI